MSEPSTVDQPEVDHTLLEWYRGMSVIERLRAASRAAATLDRLRHASTTDRGPDDEP